MDGFDRDYSSELNCEDSDAAHRDSDRGRHHDHASPGAIPLFRALAPLLGQFVRRGRLEITYRDLAEAQFGDESGPRYRVRLESLRAIPRIVRNPDLKCGESYMDGQWSVDEGDLAGLIGLFLRNYNNAEGHPVGWAIWKGRGLLARNRSNNPEKSRRNAAHHYDIGNDLYEAFLDEGMNYSCAFFERPGQSLRDAQLNKLRTTVKRLGVEPGMTVLDIGSGWGELTRVVAGETEAVRVTGITLAENQLRMARERADAMPGRRPEYRLVDYRDHAAQNPGSCDRVVSVGMFEHVGRRHLAEYFDAVRRLLRDDGRALVHSIMRPVPVETSSWILKYIFPGAYIPTLEMTVAAAQQAGLELAHAPFIHESFNYAETLRRWRHNFNQAWPRLDRTRYDERFRRMWNFYLCGAEAGFDTNRLFVGQVLLKKKG